jgi:hypothetical protein
LIFDARRDDVDLSLPPYLDLVYAIVAAAAAVSLLHDRAPKSVC